MEAFGFGHSRAGLVTILSAIFVLSALLMMPATMGVVRATTTDKHNAVTVEAQVRPFVITSVRNPLRFDIKGAVGKYESVNSAEYTLESNVPVTVKLEASPLGYEHDKSISLDVVYWVNDGVNSFKPGEPTAINLAFARYERHSLQLRGRVTIHGVANQPAGTYDGTIWVTVSAQE